MLTDFLKILENVANRPDFPVLRGKFVKFNALSRSDRSLIAACPLTQVAIKAGADMKHLHYAVYPADYVVDFLKERFNVSQEIIDYVWSEYDGGTPLLEVIAALELEMNDE